MALTKFKLVNADNLKSIRYGNKVYKVRNEKTGEVLLTDKQAAEIYEKGHKSIVPVDGDEPKRKLQMPEKV